MDFDLYNTVYPSTPDLRNGVHRDVSSTYRQACELIAQRQLSRLSLHSDACHVLVRGLFGGWIPRHFAQARHQLNQAGLDTVIAPHGAVDTIAQNSRRLAGFAQAPERVKKPLVFLCHSRAGIEVLEMLSIHDQVRSRVKAIVLCQTAREPSPVLTAMINKQAGPIWPIAMRMSGGLQACTEISRPGFRERVQNLDDLARSLPCVALASWSGQPSASLESQHKRMGKLAPGLAHDGLFLTQSMLWPGLPHVLIGDLDHSQPSVGGRGHDSGQMWLALTSTAHTLAQETEKPRRD